MALVYLATYPRSGNSLLQRMLGGNFWRLASQIKTPPLAARKLGELDGWERAAVSAPVAGWPETVLWDPYTALYRRRVEGEPWRRQLLDAPSDYLTQNVRRSLAGEDNIFFVKTHQPPFESYFEGEQVVQVTRHPGAVLWSYFRLLAQQAVERPNPRAFDRPPPTLERIIKGDVQFGGWSPYQAQWSAAAQALGERYLRLDYARMVADQAEARSVLAAFLRLPVMSDAPVSFDRYQVKHSRQGVRGRDGGYERFYSREQLELLWRIHGPVAQDHGFAAPDLQAAGENEQILRLNELLERAWSAASRSEAEAASENGQEPRTFPPARAPDPQCTTPPTPPSMDMLKPEAEAERTISSR